MLSPAELLPATIAGVPTDVIESDPASFAITALNPRLTIRPVKAGVSIAHPAVGAGTLGAICRRDPDNGRRFALSNNHVLSNLGRAAIGDMIVQPSPLDTAEVGTASSVARLTMFEPIKTDGTRNHIDAALAEFLPGMAIDPTDIIGVGTVGCGWSRAGAPLASRMGS